MKTKLINDTLYMECNVVMLPTAEIQPVINMISSKTDGKLGIVDQGLVDMFNMHKMFGDFAPAKPYQHLYIISDEQPKEGDWFYDIRESYSKTIYQCAAVTSNFVFNASKEINHPVEFCKKVIATTDSSLLIPDRNGSPQYDPHGLPQIPQSFIEDFIDFYNLGNTFDMVWIELEEYGDELGADPAYFGLPSYRPKVSKKNKISILVSAHSTDYKLVSFGEERIKLPIISNEAYEDALNIQKASNVGYESKIAELKNEISKMYTEGEMKQFAFEAVCNFLSNDDNKVEVKLVEVIIDRINSKFEKFKK